MEKKMKSKKGFTLVELVIVIVIVGILSIISVPIYRGYVEKAIMTEGKILINAIGKSELAYHVKNDCFYSTEGKVENDYVLDIDARGNKYFKNFLARSGSGSMYGSSVNASASLGVRKDAYDGEDDVVSIEVYGSNNGKSWTLRAEQLSNGSLYGFGNNGEIVDQSNELKR
jgi:prepilin-type N-terminal cleavage/methylation domain-containing protein